MLVRAYLNKTHNFKHILFKRFHSLSAISGSKILPSNGTIRRGPPDGSMTGPKFFLSLGQKWIPYKSLRHFCLNGSTLGPLEDAFLQPPDGSISPISLLAVPTRVVNWLATTKL